MSRTIGQLSAVRQRDEGRSPSDSAKRARIGEQLRQGMMHGIELRELEVLGLA